MQKREKVLEFESRSGEVILALTNLIDDMMAYSASCHQATIMLKRYNRMMKMKLDLNKSLTASCNEMRRTVECIQGDI